MLLWQPKCSFGQKNGKPSKHPYIKGKKNNGSRYALFTNYAL